MKLLLERFISPIGVILVVSDGDSVLRALDFVDYEARMHRLLRLHYGTYTLSDGPGPVAVTRALAAYFGGDLGSFEELPVETGGTTFQRSVWKALRSIPPGTTMSYGQLAAGLGRPAACRAVGLANGSNPIAIVVPCHRVIGANGSLTGYGGGISRKRWLLDHENAQSNQNQPTDLRGFDAVDLAGAIL
jgi:O-6-methylguanine DNA methyltransferase